MMVSDFIALVGNIVHSSISSLIILAIAVLITGAITHKVATSIQSGVALTVASLVVLYVWFEVWKTGPSIQGFIFTACLAVVGHEGYRRLRGAYR